MSKKANGKELSKLEQHFKMTDNVDSKEPLVYQIYSKEFGNKMKTEKVNCHVFNRRTYN